MKATDIKIGDWYGIYDSEQMAREGEYDRLETGASHNPMKVVARVTQRKFLCHDETGGAYHIPVRDFAARISDEDVEFHELEKHYQQFAASAARRVNVPE